MDTNFLPYTDLSDLAPGCCCPPFDPRAWNKLDLHFRGKPFVRVRTRSLLHIPLNMTAVMTQTWSVIRAADAADSRFVILTNDESLWHADHYFAVSRPVGGLDNVTLTGDFVTRVFDGPYRDAYIWVREMCQDIEDLGHRMGRLYFYYACCPKCAERCGHNYVVGIGEVI